MTKRLWMVLAVMANAVCICMAQDNIVRMLPENGATEVNIDTHLTLIMSDDVTIGQKGFVASLQGLRSVSRKILRHNTRLYLISISRSLSPIVTPRLAPRLV